MAEFERMPLRFSGVEGLETTLSVVPMSDRALVDSAVAALAEHQILGLSIFWTPKAQRGVYSPISAIGVSSGVDSFLFTIGVSGMMPAALQLLLTHQDYTKVGFDVRQNMVEMMYIDFGIQLYPLHDLHDILSPGTGTGTLFSTFKREHPGTVMKIDLSSRFSDWWQPRLSNAQLTFAGFETWAVRHLWLTLARPQGYPPTAKTQVLDTEALTDHIIRGRGAPRSLVAHQAARTAVPQGTLGSSTTLKGRAGPSSATARYRSASVPTVQSVTAQQYDPTVFLDDQSEYPATVYSSGMYITTDEEVNDVYTCAYCGRDFGSYKDLQQHNYARVNGLCYPDGPADFIEAKTHTTVEGYEDEYEPYEAYVEPSRSAPVTPQRGGNIASQRLPSSAGRTPRVAGLGGNRTGSSSARTRAVPFSASSTLRGLNTSAHNMTAADVSALHTSLSHHGEVSFAGVDRPTHLEEPINTASQDGAGISAAGGRTTVVGTMRSTACGGLARAGGSTSGAARNRSVTFAASPARSGSVRVSQYDDGPALSRSQLNNSGFIPPSSTAGKPRTMPRPTTSTPHRQGVSGQYSRTPRPEQRSFVGNNTRTTVSFVADQRPMIEDFDTGVLNRSEINMRRYGERIPQNSPGANRWKPPPFHMPAPLAIARTASEVGKLPR